jgi:methylmalonyl-CoA/ethylmalonyl-CoA epimerase
MGDAERGMTVELLEPYRVEEHAFLERFLTDRGPGPHHLTFKVDDLAAELDRIRAAGLHPTGVLLDSPRWKECFLHPAEAHGTVVQIAQGGLDAYPTFAEHLAAARAGHPYGEPVWWEDPGPRAEATVFLDRVVVTTPALDGATAFYTEVLEGVVAADDAHGRDVVWPGGCIRLVRDTDRAPGIARLECSGPGPTRTITVAGTDLAIAPH